MAIRKQQMIIDHLLDWSEEVYLYDRHKESIIPFTCEARMFPPGRREEMKLGKENSIIVKGHLAVDIVKRVKNNKNWKWRKDWTPHSDHRTFSIYKRR